MGKNALTEVTIREDPGDGFTRTAIVTKKERVHSIDVLTPKGEFFCRLNIAAPKEDGSWGNVDVIWTVGTHQGTAIAWLNGVQIARVTSVGSSLIAVEMKRKEQTNDEENN